MTGLPHTLEDINRLPETTQNKSSKEILLSGVPQGLVLRPPLLIYGNDICNSCNQLKFYLFADDTIFLYADKNLTSLESILNNELCKVYTWLIANSNLLMHGVFNNLSPPQITNIINFQYSPL